MDSVCALLGGEFQEKKICSPKASRKSLRILRADRCNALGKTTHKAESNTTVELVNILLERYTWKNARRSFKSTKVALVPVGSTEQHGPHLPLGTDFLTAQALAESVAKKINTICTPVIPVGVSSHHRQFWGTLWVSPDTFRRYMYEIAISLGYHGIRRIIFVNGHGGNSASLQEVSQRLRLEGIYSIVYEWWTGPSVVKLQKRLFKSNGGHADAIETAMILSIRPELVDTSSIREAATGASSTWGVTKFGAQLTVDTIDFSRSGATLDPREGTVEAGKRIRSAAEDNLLRLARWLEKTKQQDIKTNSHLP
jgi:creatinine amidohydrolase